MPRANPVGLASLGEARAIGVKYSQLTYGGGHMATEEITPETAPAGTPTATPEVPVAPLGETVAAAATATRLYPIAPGVELHVRSGPGVNYSIVKTLRAGS